MFEWEHPMWEVSVDGDDEVEGRKRLKERKCDLFCAPTSVKSERKNWRLWKTLFQGHSVPVKIKYHVLFNSSTDIDSLAGALSPRLVETRAYTYPITGEAGHNTTRALYEMS